MNEKDFPKVPHFLDNLESSSDITLNSVKLPKYKSL